MSKKQVGLFFGSFNPIHVGHLIIANHLVEHSTMDELWFVVTPQNPFKEKHSLLDNYSRLEMVHRAVEGYEKLRPSDIEFHLPQPNYTVNTLAYLGEKFPTFDFALIMGEDNLKSFHKWKNYEYILKNYPIFVYPRISEGNISKEFENHPNITKINAPIIELSATFIRNEIKEKRNVRPLLAPKVWQYIDQMGFYEK
ncbi:putative nicotinate-nucleotide adenylyltransferase [Capnocytophaga stomatis]|uniref:Probable nicotinate-nucleotide adenylyltransferase n=1 Tax=Capnocytophaga stomatis TaxID=1848904 RepID=A0A250FU21_9FLAO|nr:nicotinate (nicotinamide) nucleotide adenylyltransferase [Capnocytophaga stomatis]ATA88521.1 nicotinic acid mononucleotide adenylyltransferase [Capnocytophaga stomatis]GIJ93234.1 putative nicotinate-nucleotide adenylyltransferase [Capnocytophaga stomatis]GIJ96059.1 putative nicotinate-nucleotide adenylyltransferase [Capnocytophaga stomatis]GIM50329.1 putative nicotinate-nucleotide adenylyltransferase [Capnocytophaga stomatis]